VALGFVLPQDQHHSSRDLEPDQSIPRRTA
jgi:hypothetical protein